MRKTLDSIIDEHARKAKTWEDWRKVGRFVSELYRGPRFEKFSPKDWDDFMGCEFDAPLIARLHNCEVVIDDATVCAVVRTKHDSGTVSSLFIRAFDTRELALKVAQCFVRTINPNFAFAEALLGESQDEGAWPL